MIGSVPHAGRPSKLFRFLSKKLGVSCPDMSDVHDLIIIYLYVQYTVMNTLGLVRSYGASKMRVR
jgi:hypothetical protein